MISLKTVWDAARYLQYQAALLDLYRPAAVQQGLLKQGWNFSTEPLPLMMAGGYEASVQTVTIVKTPEGQPITIDDAARHRFEAARTDLVKRHFGIS